MTDFALQDVCKDYTLGPSRLSVLRGVSLEVDFGQRVAIVGPSGCGKSTLLNLIGLLDAPTSGSITLDGQEWTNLSAQKLAEIRATKIGFVFQNHHLLPHLTALENVCVPVLATERNADRFEQAAVQLLNEVGLSDRQHHLPSQLSGGECQRVAIARALIRQPQLLLADEPTGNLDQTNANLIADVLLQTAKQTGPKTIALIVTHSLALAGRCDRVFQLDNGVLQPHVDDHPADRPS